VSKVKVEILPDFKEKLKGYIHWVSKEHSLNASVNLYAVHFLVEDIKKAGDKWLDFVNPNSLLVKNNAKIWDMHKRDPIESRYQFERCGYFILDQESDLKKGKYVFNRIVELKESKDKSVNI